MWDDQYSDYRDEVWPAGIMMEFYYWMIPGLVGLITLVFAYSYHYDNYREVVQGKVLDKDVTGGGNTAIEHLLLIECYTKSNHLRQQWRSVTLGTLEEYEKGDYYDSRER